MAQSHAGQQDDHARRVRSAFTAQAVSYSGSARIADPEGRRAFAAFVAPPATALALDIATGPGFVALAFAERVRRVVAVDLTPAMLARAGAERGRRDAANLDLALADAGVLPCADGTFDLITCGSAFHHFPQPDRILAEMTRVLRPGGLVAISDIITSDDSAKAARHNAIERLRDPSHTRALPLSELAALSERCGLRTLRTETSRRERALGEWVAISRTPDPVVARVRSLLVEAIDDDVAGIGVWLADDEPHFWHTTAWYVAQKPE
ncbi:MAG: class I SAM-dependent methyltransferase [Dehalococcoidia bacterium]